MMEPQLKSLKDIMIEQNNKVVVDEIISHVVTSFIWQKYIDNVPFSEIEIHLPKQLLKMLNQHITVIFK